MIPQELKISNFMSYGENLPALDLSQIELACLVGLNGAGKSSILEAMVWSLWGKSRAKSDDDLVRQGKNQMFVDFIFTLNQEEYRVIRKKSKDGKGQSNLEFYKRNPKINQDQWSAISGSTKAETQEIIIDTLKMTYDTFVNSAFLRQGKADEFTIKKPTERKKVLSQILNLYFYDRLVMKAKQEAKKLLIEQESLNKKIEYIESEVNSKDELDTESEKMQQELSKIQAEIEQYETKLIGLNKQKSTQDSKIDEIRNLDENIKSISDDLEKINIEITENYESIESAKKFLIQEEEIKDKYQQYLELKKKDNLFENLLKEKNRIDQEKNSTEKKILINESSLLQKKGNLEYRLKLITESIKEKELLFKEAEELKNKIIKLRELEKLKSENDKKLDRVTENISLAQTDLKLVETKGKELKEKIIKLDGINSSNCPLCDQRLTADHKIKVIKDLSDKKNIEAQKYIKIKSIIEKLKTKNKQLNLEKNKMETALIALPGLENDLKLTQEKIEAIKVAEKEKLMLTQDLNDCEKKLTTGTYDKGNHHKLEEIERKLVRLGYDELEHQKIKNKISELADIENKKQKLDSIKTEIKQLEKFLDKIIKNRIAKERELKKYKLRKSNIKINYEKIEQVEKEIKDTNDKLYSLRNEINSKQGECGAINERVKRAQTLLRELKESRGEYIKVVKQKNIYDGLIKAFGKNGVQAMIIESAVPEIEDEANRLLSKMSDGKMKVWLKTKKHKKTDGDLADTLDILIEDENGMRSYEMFSGGEAYRINFAIRIALSKLLANRTGAKLQFLVIDEGFGTQDVLGRESLIEAINSISGDFKKIFVITHIPELKDVFPARIEIEKDENGSRFAVVA